MFSVVCTLKFLASIQLQVHYKRSSEFRLVQKAHSNGKELSISGYATTYGVVSTLRRMVWFLPRQLESSVARMHTHSHACTINAHARMPS